MDTEEDVEKMLEDCADVLESRNCPFSHWEKGFIESIHEQYTEKGYLTETQIQYLEKAWKKI